jgi:hypothetical protein
MRAGRARFRAASARKACASPIFGEWDGSETARAPSAIGPKARGRRMNAAVPSKSNLNLRLEHQFQTAMRRQRGARPQFRSSAHGMAQYRSSGFLRHWHARCARGSGCPHPRGHSAALRRHRHHVCREHDSNKIWCRSGSKATSASLPSSFSGSQSRRTITAFAGCPNATQPEPVTVSTLFIRPLAGNWQVGCGIWRCGSEIRLGSGPPLPSFKFQLTMRP